MDFHKRPESQISDNSISSETWKDLKHSQLFRQGILAMEKGKKRDQAGAYIEALLFYEDGMRLLMEAANQADHNEENNIVASGNLSSKPPSHKTSRERALFIMLCCITFTFFICHLPR